jgi:tripartite-type tricarboxylate transporter receptor subunit TctC
MRRRPLLALPLALPGVAHAQAEPGFPTRPVTLVIPFPPGGIVDTTGRLIAERVARALGQPVIIENRPGAGSAIANAQVAQARPDGYMVLAGGIGLAIIPHLRPDLEPRDPMRALAAVAGTHTTPYILHVTKQLPARTLGELVTWAKARGAALNVATSGAGTGVHLTWELFRRRAGITQGEVVHFRGGVQAITEVAAGRADLIWSTALEAIQAMRANQTRPIAVTSLQRLAALPDLPTVAESGFPGFEVASFSGWFAPAGTPPPVLARLEQALRAAVSDPELVARFQDFGVEARFQTAGELAATLAAEHARWGRMIREAGVRVDG